MWQREERRVNHKELKEMKTDAQLTSLREFVSKNKSIDEWKSAVLYVFKHVEDAEQQIGMLQQLYAVLAELNPTSLANVLNDISEEYKLCRSLGAFYLSMKYLMRIKSYPRYTDSLRKIYSSLIEKFGLYEQEITELEGVGPKEYPVRLVQEISAAIEGLPKLFECFRDRLSFACLPVLLAWIVVYPQDTREQVRSLSDFCKYIVKDLCQKGVYNEYNQKTVNDLMVMLINRSSLNYPGNDALYHVVDALPQNMIHNLDESEDIVVIDIDRIITCFSWLTASSVTTKVLRAVYAVSFGLRRDEDYYALNKLYKEFVLPRLIRDAKAIIDGQTILRNIVDFYVDGFVGWSTIIKDDLKYFLHHYQLLNRRDLIYWLRKAFLSCGGSTEMLEELNRLTRDIVRGDLNEIMSVEDYHKSLEGSWELVQDDLLHQRKKYVYKISKLSGIRNTSSNCYIISSMQALFMTKFFPELLRCHSKDMVESGGWTYSPKIKLRLLYELNFLMNELKEGRTLVKVDLVKLYGPSEFKQIQGQQDCHEYLIQLLDCVEKELNKLPGKAKEEGATKFKSLFELSIQSALVCQSCKARQVNTTHPNVHSIGCQEKLQLQWTEHVDHKCDSCKSSNPNRQQLFRIIKLPQVLLVHLKRFEYRDGKSIKRLDQAEMPRQFNGYRLMGFISHIGRNSLSGHYVLYCRKDDNLEVWYEFNDEKVFEFRTSHQDEPFERNFKLSNTPYILIYRKQ